MLEFFLVLQGNSSVTDYVFQKFTKLIRDLSFYVYQF